MFDARREGGGVGLIDQSNDLGEDSIASFVGGGSTSIDEPRLQSA